MLRGFSSISACQSPHLASGREPIASEAGAPRGLVRATAVACGWMARHVLSQAAAYATNARPVEAAIETEKQVIAPFCEWKHNGRPELEYLIQTRDRLAAHADAPAPTTRWSVCDNRHHHDVFAPPVLMEGRNARHSWGKGLVYQPRKRAGLASRSMRPDGASYRQCDWCYLGRKRTDSTWGAPSGCAMMSTTSRSPAGPMMTFAASGLRPPLLDCALS